MFQPDDQRRPHTLRGLDFGDCFASSNAFLVPASQQPYFFLGDGDGLPSVMLRMPFLPLRREVRWCISSLDADETLEAHSSQQGGYRSHD